MKEGGARGGLDFGENEILFTLYCNANGQSVKRN